MTENGDIVGSVLDGGEQAELPGDAGAANGISDDAGVLVGEVDSDEDSKEAVIWTATE